MNRSLTLGGILSMVLLLSTTVVAQESVSPAIVVPQPNEKSTAQNLLVTVRILELDRAKMRRLGIDFQTADGPVDVTALEGRAALPLGFIKALEKEGIVTEFDSATMVLKNNGKPAEFFQGGEVEVPSTPGNTLKRRYGTQLKVNAEPADGRLVRLDVDLRNTELDESQMNKLVGPKIPSFRVRACQTSCEMELGQTVVVPGMKDQSKDGNITEMLVVISAEVWVAPYATAGP